MLVRFDHVARFIVNANHGIVRAAVGFGVIDYIADRKGPRLFSPRGKIRILDSNGAVERVIPVPFPILYTADFGVFLSHDFFLC